MQLDELSQIAKGVKAAQEGTAGCGGSVNPSESEVEFNELRLISFDVAVTILDETKGEARGRLAVLPLTLSTGGETSSANTTVSRVQFSIPMQIPTMEPVGVSRSRLLRDHLKRSNDRERAESAALRHTRI